MSLSERTREMLAIAPAAEAIEFEGRCQRWVDLARQVAGREEALAAAAARCGYRSLEESLLGAAHLNSGGSTPLGASLPTGVS